MMIEELKEFTGIDLIRVAYGEKGTFGVLLYDKYPFAVTVERPWVENKRNVSCIPEGTYVCKRILSPKFGDTFEVTGVPNRSAILFHKGNISEDTHGCIIVGEQFHLWPDRRPSIAASKQGFEEFMYLTRHVNEFHLVIRGVDKDNDRNG